MVFMSIRAASSCCRPGCDFVSGLLSTLPLAAFDFDRQGFEIRLPEAAKAREPLVDLRDRRRIDLVDPARSVGVDRREAMVAQHFQMLGDGGLRDPELLPHDRDDLSRGVAILGEDLENAPADRIAEDVDKRASVTGVEARRPTGQRLGDCCVLAGRGVRTPPGLGAGAHEGLARSVASHASLAAGSIVPPPLSRWSPRARNERSQPTPPAPGTIRLPVRFAGLVLRAWCGPGSGVRRRSPAPDAH